MLHAMLAAPLALDAVFLSKEQESVTIAYIQYEVSEKSSETAVAAVPKILEPSPAEKKPPAAPVFRKRWVPPRRVVVREAFVSPAKVLREQAPVRESRELLNDPLKRRTFTNYFGLIKQKIHTTIQRKYLRYPMDRGTVTLAFILKADGTLEKVTTVDAETHASQSVKDFAAQCVRESAPFASFPKTLGSSRIAFNVTVFFEEF
jgi:hypothetical protein